MEASLNRADRYIADVVSGKQVTSKLVRLACKRHLDDLANGHLRDLRFSQGRADHIIQFIETFCRHSQGKWAAQEVLLEPWQCAMFSLLYGWEYISTGRRRFRFAWIETAKGQASPSSHPAWAYTNSYPNPALKFMPSLRDVSKPVSASQKQSVWFVSRRTLPSASRTTVTASSSPVQRQSSSLGLVTPKPSKEPEYSAG